MNPSDSRHLFPTPLLGLGGGGPIGRTGLVPGLSLCVYVSLFVCLFVCLYVCLSAWLSFTFLFIYVCFPLLINLLLTCLCMYVCVCVWGWIFFCVSTCVCVSMFMFSACYPWTRYTKCSKTHDGSPHASHRMTRHCDSLQSRMTKQCHPIVMRSACQAGAKVCLDASPFAIY